MAVKNQTYAFLILTAVSAVSALICSCLPCSWIHPDFCLIFVCAAALIYGSRMGMLFGMASGIISAADGGFSWSAFAFLYACAGFLSGKFLRPYNDKFLIFILSVFLSSVFLVFGIYIFGISGIFIMPDSEIVKSQFLAASAGNLIFAWPVMRIINKLIGSYWFVPLKFRCD